jgi:hypothetical protein
MQQSEPEEAVTENVPRGEVRAWLPRSELERAEARRREQSALLDDTPEADWLRGNWGWAILAAVLVALAAWLLYLALA